MTLVRLNVVLTVDEHADLFEGLTHMIDRAHVNAENPHADESTREFWKSRMADLLNLQTKLATHQKTL